MTALSRKDRSRALIREAAEAAFREKPFDEVSMEEIAQRAGLTRKTLYNLFASKEDIARQIVAAGEVEGGARYRARMAAGADALALLEEYFVECARWCLDNPSIAPIAIAGPPEGLSMTPPAGRDSTQAMVRDLMAYGQARGKLRRDQPDFVLAGVLLGSFANAMRFVLAGGPLTPEQMGGLVRLIVQGIGAHAETPAEVRRMP